MEGKNYFTILGLLLALALSSFLAGLQTSFFYVEMVISLWFLFVMACYIFIAFHFFRHAHSMVLFSFAVGVINAVVLAFAKVSVWAVMVLVLSLAGIVIVMSVSARPVRSRVASRSVRRKSILEKELPKEEKVEVVVYERQKGVAVKKSKKKSSRKSATKKKSSAAKISKKKTSKQSQKQSQKKVSQKSNSKK